MVKLSDNIRKIARTAELDAKIRSIPEPTDRSSIPSTRGVSERTPEQVCAAYYGLRDNSYDIGALLAGTVGPTLADQCSRLNTITGLTDVDPAENVENLDGVVHLVLQIDGVFD